MAVLRSHRFGRVKSSVQEISARGSRTSNKTDPTWLKASKLLWTLEATTSDDLLGVVDIDLSHFFKLEYAGDTRHEATSSACVGSWTKTRVLHIFGYLVLE